MSDRLREALEVWDDGNYPEHGAQWQIIVAAGRWLALTETGQREWRCVGEGNRCGPHSFLWRDETHDRCGQVLVISADYLTEEE